jgi:hypothetical protein
MKLSFIEAMRGWVAGEDGVEHPIAFEVRAEETARRGHFALSGILWAPPFVPQAEARGTLVIAPFLRSLTYDLEFAGLRLRAEKHPSILAPKKTMTEMIATITRGDDIVARGMMRFDLADTIPFVASWLQIRTEAARRLHAGAMVLERKRIAG